MNLEDQLLFFFSAIGAFNGFIFSMYFAFFFKNRNKATYFLAGLLFVISVRVAKSVFFTFSESITDTFLHVGLTACLLIGPFLYLYVRAAKKHENKTKYGWLLHVIPILLFMIVVHYQYPYSEYRYLWQRKGNGYFGWFLFIQWFVYIIFSGFYIKDSFKNLLKKKMKATNLDIWLVSLVLGVGLIWFTYYTTAYTSYIFGALSFSFVFYLLVLFWVFKKSRNGFFLEEKVKYANKRIEDDDAKLMASQIDNIIKEKELFKNPDLKLKDVADKLHILPHYLSQFLNDNLGKSFKLFINEYRIEEAKRLLTNGNKFTTEAIGYECGFNSKSTFFTTFKKVTGLTPAGYRGGKE